ncbi:hypothetical protein ACFQYP_49210 [Nonomuraea antimicrobica]
MDHRAARPARRPEPVRPHRTPPGPRPRTTEADPPRPAPARHPLGRHPRPAAPVFTGHRFEVRLGDQAARDDGLIGYFTADGAAGYRYDRFHSLISPDDGQDYVTQIGPPGPAPDGNYLRLTFADPAPTRLLLLLDPRAAVHATSGITPTATATVPPSHVDDALRHLQVLFRFGPVLTTEHAQTLAFPGRARSTAVGHGCARRSGRPPGLRTS